MSSPQMTRMFGGLPLGDAPEVGPCCCAFAAGPAAEPATAIAAREVPVRRKRRRSAEARSGAAATFSSRSISLSLGIPLSPCSGGHRDPFYASESDVARRGVDGLGVPRCGSVTPAIVGRAQMRAALEHLAGN